MPLANSALIFRSIALAVLLTGCPGASGSSDESTEATSSTTDPSSMTGSTTAVADASTSGSTTGDTDGGACESPRLLARWVVPDLVESTDCFGVGMDDAGGILFLGGSRSTDAYHAQLVRLSDGVVEWSVLHPATNAFVNALGLAVRSDGVALMTGFADDDDPIYFQRLPWTATYDAIGNLMSESIVTHDDCPRPPCVDGENHAAVVTASGEFLVAGAQSNPDGTFNRRIAIRRYDATIGELALTELPTPAGDSRDIAHAIALSADGSVVVLGQVGERTLGFDTDLWIARLTADLMLVDASTLDAGEDDEPGGVAALDDGSIVFAAGGSQQYIARVSAGLRPVWSLPNGGYGPLVLGNDAIFAVVGEDRIVEKLDLDGAPQWADDPCLDGDRADALALSPDGMQLIVGRWRGAEFRDHVVELYDAGS